MRRSSRHRRTCAAAAAVVLAVAGTARTARAQARGEAGGGSDAAGRDTIVLPALRAEVLRSIFDPGLARSVERLRPGESLVPYRDLGQWLGARTGATVRRYGAGGRQLLSLRGGRPEGVLVLLDGMPINDPLTGAADLSSVTLSSVESATLVRGSGSARYGSGALGGALLLRSANPGGGAPRGRIAVGSYGRYELAATTDWATGGGGIRLGAGLQGAENDFPYRDPADPSAPERTRDNADAGASWFDGTARFGDVRAGLRYDGLDRGVPGRMGSAVFAGDRWSEHRWSLTAGVSTDRVHASGGVRWLNMRYEPGGGSASRQEAVDARAAGEVALPGTGGWMLGGRASVERLAGEDIAGTAQRWTAGATVRRVFEGETVGVEPILALDLTGEDVAVSPELGAWWRPADRTRVYGRVGRGFRAPTLADLHFQSAPGLRANPALAPEIVALDTEVGVEAAPDVGIGDLSLRVAAWRRDTRDPIVWLASSAALWSPQNLDRLLAWGVDLDARVAEGGEAALAWAVDGGLTLQRSRVGYGTNRNPLPYEPGVTARLGVEVAAGATAGRFQAAWTGSRTTTVAATRRLDGFLLVDATLRRRVTPGPLVLDLSLSVDNVFGVGYELVELYPEPGRTLRLTVDVR